MQVIGPIMVINRPATIGWFRGAAAERWSLTGEVSLSCARPTDLMTDDHLCG